MNGHRRRVQVVTISMARGVEQPLRLGIPAALEVDQ
jgi:hypothetical protein